MPGLLKIGWTDRSPQERVSELSASTGVPTPFLLEFYVQLDNALLAEREIHKKFFEFRVNGSREFFSVSLDVAVKELKQLRLSQVLELIDSLETEFRPFILEHLLGQDPSLLNEPNLQPGRLDAAISALLKWDDPSLLKVIDALLSQRGGLRSVFYLR